MTETRQMRSTVAAGGLAHPRIQALVIKVMVARYLLEAIEHTMYLNIPSTPSRHL